jgi:hypothetical protein
MSNTPIARKVVKECLQVKEDEQVLIQTWDHTLDISNSLAGFFPELSHQGSREILREDPESFALTTR